MTYVEVNEARIFATTGGASWWVAFRQRFEPIGRVEIVTASIGGDRVRVKCDDREHADWLKATALDNGVPVAAVKVVKG